MALDDFEFKLDGLDDALDRIRKLPEKLQRRAVRAAVRKGANIVKSAAVANAKAVDDPSTPERIHANVTVQFSARDSKREGGIVMRVGVRGGARQYADTRENRRKQRVGSTYKTLGDKSNPGGDTWYWRFVELGTSRTKARPFLRPALTSNIERATDAIATELSRQLDRLETP